MGGLSIGARGQSEHRSPETVQSEQGLPRRHGGRGTLSGLSAVGSLRSWYERDEVEQRDEGEAEEAEAANQVNMYCRWP